MKKKLLVILLFIIAVFSLTLTGCGLYEKSLQDSTNNNDTSNFISSGVTYTSISTLAELQSLANKSGKFKLVNDIDLSGIEWKPIDGFSGVLEGDEKNISGLTISGNKANIGLFSTLKGTVLNLNIFDVNITGTGSAGNVGAVCGTNEGLIKNVKVDGTINTPFYNNVGGIAGESDIYTTPEDTTHSQYYKDTHGIVDVNIDIIDCTNQITVIGYENVGGIVGYLSPSKGMTFGSNINDGAVSGRNYVGGVVGYVCCGSPNATSSGETKFTNNINQKAVSGASDYVGGLIGYQTSNRYRDVVFGNYYTYLNISNCSNLGNVIGKDDVGGIIGFGEYVSIVSSSTNSANITGSNYVGGCVGYASGATVKIATNNNTITGKGYVGGIAGYGGSMDNCINNGEITSTAVVIEDMVGCAYVGGIAGYAATINDCSNNVDINVTTNGVYVGGIVGYLSPRNAMTLDSNVNDGQIRGTDYVGGIAGCICCGSPKTTSSGEVKFTNNINQKAVSGTGDYVGGLVGYQTSDSLHDPVFGYYYTYLSIANCSNLGVVSGKNYAGGIIAYGLYTAKNDSLWATNTNFGAITGSNKGDKYGYLK